MSPAQTICCLRRTIRQLKAIIANLEEGTHFLYRRPDGTSLFHRPDGVSLYTRP